MQSARRRRRPPTKHTVVAAAPRETAVPHATHAAGGWPPQPDGRHGRQRLSPRWYRGRHEFTPAAPNSHVSARGQARIAPLEQVPRVIVPSVIVTVVAVLHGNVKIRIRWKWEGKSIGVELKIGNTFVV